MTGKIILLDFKIFLWLALTFVLKFEFTEFVWLDIYVSIDIHALLSFMLNFQIYQASE